MVHESNPQTSTTAIRRVPPGAGTPQLFARAGAPVAAIPGATLVEAELGRLYETGHYVWTARIAGPGITSANDRVAFLTLPGARRR